MGIREVLDPEMREERGSCTMMLLIYFWITVIVLMWNAQEGSSRVRVPSSRVKASAECGVDAGVTMRATLHIRRRSLPKETT